MAEINVKLPFYELQHHIKVFTNITAHALLSEFEQPCRIGNDPEKRDEALERLHRTTEFLVAYLFEKIFPVNELVYEGSNSSAYTVYRESWLRIMAAFANQEGLGNDSNFKEYYHRVHAYKVFIDEQMQRFEALTESKDAKIKWDELKKDKEKSGNWPKEPMLDIGALSGIEFEDLTKEKSGLFRAWVERYKGKEKIRGTDEEQLVRYYEPLQCSESVKGWFGAEFSGDMASWFALHFWHHRETFRNRKLLLLFGAQWDEKMSRLMAVFPYSPVALPKVVFNPADAHSARKVEKFKTLFKDYEKNPYQTRQGSCAFFRKPPIASLNYMDSKFGIGIVIDTKSLHFPRVEAGKIVGGEGTEVKAFLTELLETKKGLKTKEEAYLTLVSSVEFWEAWRKDYKRIEHSITNTVDAVYDHAKRALNIELENEGAAALIQTMLTWDWKYMYMIPGELWNTTIGGVGFSFNEPLSDEEFRQMRLLIQAMLAPYSLAERTLLELSHRDEDTVQSILKAGEKMDQIDKKVRVFCEKELYPLISEARSYVEPTDFTKLKEFLKKTLGCLTHGDEAPTGNPTIQLLFSQAKEALSKLNLSEEPHALAENFLEVGENEFFKGYLEKPYSEVPENVKGEFNKVRDTMFKVEKSTLIAWSFNHKLENVELFCCKEAFHEKLKHLIRDSSLGKASKNIRTSAYSLAGQPGLIFFLISKPGVVRQYSNLFLSGSPVTKQEEGRFRDACLWMAKYSVVAFLESQDKIDLRAYKEYHEGMKEYYPQDFEHSTLGTNLIFGMRL
jgi:hypothetical protein